MCSYVFNVQYLTTFPFVISMSFIHCKQYKYTEDIKFTQLFTSICALQLNNRFYCLPLLSPHQGVGLLLCIHGVQDTEHINLRIIFKHYNTSYYYISVSLWLINEDTQRH
jgi:hypothetical protein